MFVLINICSCSDYDAYKSPYLGKKFKSRQYYVYSHDIGERNRFCDFTRIFKAKYELDEFHFEFNGKPGDCVFKKTGVKTYLIPKGTEFEVVDSFKREGLLGWGRVEYVVLKDKFGDLSETIETSLYDEIEYVNNRVNYHEAQLILENDLKYLRNKNLNMILCDAHNRLEPFPDYNEENLNKEVVLDQSPFIELKISNFIQQFKLNNELEILELLWVKTEKFQPCALIRFKTKEAYVTSMYHMDRWDITPENRAFIKHPEIEIFENPVKSLPYENVFILSEENLRTKYHPIDVSKMSAKQLHEYRREKMPN